MFVQPKLRSPGVSTHRSRRPRSGSVGSASSGRRAGAPVCGLVGLVLRMPTGRAASGTSASDQVDPPTPESARRSRPLRLARKPRAAPPAPLRSACRSPGSEAEVPVGWAEPIRVRRGPTGRGRGTAARSGGRQAGAPGLLVTRAVAAGRAGQGGDDHEPARVRRRRRARPGRRPPRTAAARTRRGSTWTTRARPAALDLVVAARSRTWSLMTTPRGELVFLHGGDHVISVEHLSGCGRRG